MSNTKAEIIDAAVADGLLSDGADGESMTKSELLGLWWGG
jgi:hypothetical protein